MNDKHIQWIDALKGFGIFCVTFGHLNPWYPLETHIFSFHMCLFFFLSGFLFKQDESLSHFISKKFKSLLIPFLVWDFLSSLAAILLGEGIKETIAKFFVINGQFCWNRPIWFLLILFIAESIYAFIAKYNSSKSITLLVFIASAVLWMQIGECVYPLKLNLVPLALFFYGLGDIFHKLFNKHPISKTPIILIVLMGIISVQYGAILNIRISYYGGWFGNFFYCMIAAIAGTIFYVLLFKNWRQLGENKILCVLGENSLIIMATQYWFFRFFDKVSRELFHISVWHDRGTLKALIFAIITISFTVTGVSALKKIFKNNKKVLHLAKYIGIR